MFSYQVYPEKHKDPWFDHLWQYIIDNVHVLWETIQYTASRSYIK